MQRGKVDIFHHQAPSMYQPAKPPTEHHSQHAPVFQPPPDVPVFYQSPQPETPNPEPHAPEGGGEGNYLEQEFVDNRVGREYTFQESFYHEQPMGQKEEPETTAEVTNLHVFQQALQRFEAQAEKEAEPEVVEPQPEVDILPEQEQTDEITQSNETEEQAPAVISVDDDVTPSEEQETETESGHVDDKENLPPSPGAAEVPHHYCSVVQ